MRPTFDQIRRAAYDRWEHRGGIHGGDCDDWYAAEKELTFLGNYRTIVEYELDGPRRWVLEGGATRRCRFCERTPDDADFGQARPVMPDRAALLSAEVCDDCQHDWREGLEDEFRRFWAGLHQEGPPGSGELDLRGSPLLSAGAFKSLAAAALLIVPATELPYFIDALEWVSNPDHGADDLLLDGAECWVYRAPFLGEGTARASLARRVDDDAPVPYMIYFLAADGVMVQLPMPMCLRDEDLDGRPVERPERVPAEGFGPEFREARAVLLPLAVSGRRAGRAHRTSPIAR